MKETRSSSDVIKWDPADYAANSASQQAWARELIRSLALSGHERILDAGCGDGKITAELARAVPSGSVVGIDASPEMIRFAEAAYPQKEFPNLEFHCMDARRVEFVRRFDRVFSNATLHWVDDHRAFLRGAAAVLRPGGTLVVSCGGKGNAQDVFVALRSKMRQTRWREFFRDLKTPYFFHTAEEYRKWLPQFGFKASTVRLTPKVAIHENRESFTAWLRTTWMPYTQRVPPDSREVFIATVVNSYLEMHPPDAQCRVHVRMVRLEIVAEKQ